LVTGRGMDSLSKNDKILSFPLPHVVLDLHDLCTYVGKEDILKN